MATELTRKTLEQFIKQGVTNKELDAAKGYLIGSFPLSIASNQSLASILLKMAFYHLPDNYLATYPDKIAAVKASDIHKAFKKQLKPEQLLELTVGAS